MTKELTLIASSIVVTTIVIAGTLLMTYYTSSKQPTLHRNAIVDRILVEKGKRKMHVYQQGELLKTYDIALGPNPIGHKQVEGDGKTPEGVYRINDKNDRSAYYLNLGVSYPNQQDQAHADSLGQGPGGDIKIHGLKNGLGFLGRTHLRADWTAGCIAVTNEEIEELFRAVPVGAEIEIRE